MKYTCKSELQRIRAITVLSVFFHNLKLDFSLKINLSF